MVALAVKEGYKKTDMGIIPDDWEVKELSELVTLMTNGFVGKATVHYTESDNGVLYIQGFNVEENSFNFTGIKRVTREFHKKHMKSCLKEGDLLTIQTGEIGLTTIVPKELEGSNCHALIITRFKPGFCPKFFSYYFNSGYGRNRIKEIETGTTMKHINIGDMIHFKVSYPKEKEEQCAIANVLSDVDTLIESLENLIEKKKNIKQGAMQELLTGRRRLKGDWITKRNQKTTDVGIIPEDWDIKTFDELFILLPTGTNARSDLSEHGDVGYIHYGDIHAKWRVFLDCAKENISFIASEKIRNLPYVEDGDLVIADASEDYAGIGKSVEVKNVREKKIVCGLHTFFLRGDKKKIVNGYKAYLTSIPVVKKALISNATGISVYGISKGAIKNIQIPLPSDLKEQSAIASVINDMEEEINALEQKRDKYKQLKMGMMQQLLTGRIRLKWKS